MSDLKTLTDLKGEIVVVGDLAGLDVSRALDDLAAANGCSTINCGNVKVLSSSQVQYTARALFPFDAERQPNRFSDR